MKNEKLLYDYIDYRGGTIICNYKDIAKVLNISVSTLKNYKNTLVKNGYMSCVCICMSDKNKKLIFKIKKD